MLNSLIIRCLISFLIALFISFCFYSRVYFPPHKSEQMRNLEYTFNNDDYNDVIFIGSSRVLRQINPLLIDSITHLRSYSLGIDQIGIIESKMLLKSYLAHHPKPKVVFLNIDLSTFMFNTKSAGPYNLDEYFSYLDDTLIYNELSRYNFRIKYKDFFEKWFHTKSFWKSFTLNDSEKKEYFLGRNNHQNQDKSPKIMQSRGFIETDRNWNEQAQTELEEINKAVPTNIPTTQAGFELLNEFCDLCAKNRIECKFVFVPWYNKVNRNPDHFEVLQKVKDIASLKKVPFIDYSNLSMAGSSKYFYDCWHFNKLGSRRYSILLAEEILKNKL